MMASVLLVIKYLFSYNCLRIFADDADMDVQCVACERYSRCIPSWRWAPRSQGQSRFGSQFHQRTGIWTIHRQLHATRHLSTPCGYSFQRRACYKYVKICLLFLSLEKHFLYMCELTHIFQPNSHCSCLLLCRSSYCVRAGNRRKSIRCRNL